MPCRQDSHRRFIERGGGGGQRQSPVTSGGREKEGEMGETETERERCRK